MKWKKYTIHTTAEAEDLVSLMLNELGVGGVEIDDGIMPSAEDIEKQFIDILPEMSDPDGKADVSFYLHLEDPEEGPGKKETMQGTVDDSYTINDRIWTMEEVRNLEEEIRERLKEMRAFADIGEGTIDTGETEETDWRDNWKEFFRPILIGKILIIPSWLSVPEEYEAPVKSGEIKTIVIDPGTAFGTGAHETTKLCVPAIEKFSEPGSKVLDIGTGSGILAMAASRLGAGKVLAFDVDPDCEPVVKGNCLQNGIENVKAFTANILGDEKALQAVREEGPFDMAVANILAPVIIALSEKGVVDSLVRPGGVFITSGILSEYAADVKKAMEENDSWLVKDVTSLGEWVQITAERK